MSNKHVSSIRNMHVSIYYKSLDKIADSNISKNYFHDMIQAYKHFEVF